MSTPTLTGAAFLAAPPLRAVLAALNGEGEETRIVGGAVRNGLLGEAVGEVDLASTCLPEEVVRRAEAAGLKSVPTGIAHGTVTVVSAGVPFEVTTLREDVETDGRHAVVRFGRDWARDAARRDFTLNALYADVDGRVFDPVGGLPDLMARRVRFIGDAETRIREDHLRILRLFRFHATYAEGPVDAEALRAAERLRAGLDQLSRERVRAEMVKLLVARHAAETLVEMTDAGLLTRIIAGVPDLAGFARLTGLEADRDVRPEAMRRLAALAVRIPEDAERLRTRLRLANAEHARLLAIAGAWDVRPGLSAPDARAFIFRLGPDVFRDALLIAAARRGGDPAELLALAATWPVPAFPLAAQDLMALGLKPGPKLGAALTAARKAWVAADFPADADRLADIARAAVAAGGGVPPSR